MENERFVDVKGFEGVYRIGNKGTLLSCKKHGKFTGEKTEWHPLSNVNKKGGYFSVVLEYDGKTKYCRIHRLVYEHFIGELPRGCKWVVHHINGDKQDNRVENLELLSALQHSHKHNNIEEDGYSMVRLKNKKSDKKYGGYNTMYGAMNYYNQHIRPQIIIQKDLEGNFIAQYDNAAEASRATGVCARNIKQVAGKEEFCPGHIRKQAGGFIWEQVSRS